MQAIQSKYVHGLIHVAAWGVLLGMPLFFTGSQESVMTFEKYLHFLIIPLSFMVVFYVNYFSLIHRYLFAKHVGRFVLCNVLLIGVVMVSVHILFRCVLPPPEPADPTLPPRSWRDMVRFFTNNALLYLLVACVAISIRMTGEWFRAAAERKELEKMHAEAELQNLKSQLNPHFLFNTLNNIYSLIEIDAERAQQSVHELSRMLRYVLYDSSQAFVPLKEEIGFIRNYIELMRIRMPRHVEVSVSLPESPSSVMIAPLLFISLVENAFKHGVSNECNSYIHSRIEEQNSSVVCRIENSLFPKTSVQDCSGSGIGLKNLTKRLEMIYPGRFVFEYGAIGNAYMSCLTVQLQDGLIGGSVYVGR